MGETRILIEVFPPGGRKTVPISVDVLADTGATLTAIPEAILKSLGVKKIEEVEIEVADGRTIVREVGETRIKVNGRLVTTRIIFGKKGDAPVLGTIVLDGLGLAIDPIRRRLVPVKLLFI